MKSRSCSGGNVTGDLCARGTDVRQLTNDGASGSPRTRSWRSKEPGQPHRGQTSGWSVMRNVRGIFDMGARRKLLAWRMR